MTNSQLLLVPPPPLRPDVSKMKNLVMGFGRRAKKTAAAKTRQLAMLEKMKDYCEEEGVCRRYALHDSVCFPSFFSAAEQGVLRLVLLPSTGIACSIVRAVLAVVLNEVVVAYHCALRRKHIHTYTCVLVLARCLMPALELLLFMAVIVQSNSKPICEMKST